MRPFVRSIDIRPFIETDLSDLLNLMKDLAVFEGYREEFRVTENYLITHGLKADKPKFQIFVACVGDKIVGYTSFYKIDFTYDLRPTYILKELFVAKGYRGYGCGEKLFTAVQKYAQTDQAARLQWLVLPDNQKAMKFYRRLGGQVNNVWENWQVLFA